MNANTNPTFPRRVIAKVSIPNPHYIPAPDWSLEVRKSSPASNTRMLLVEEECFCHCFLTEGENDSSCVVGLIERADGSLQTTWVELIRFVNPTKL